MSKVHKFNRFILIAAIFFSPQPASGDKAPHIVRGAVFDSGTGSSLAGVIVVVDSPEIDYREALEIRRKDEESWPWAARTTRNSVKISDCGCGNLVFSDSRGVFCFFDTAISVRLLRPGYETLVIHFPEDAELAADCAEWRLGAVGMKPVR